MNYLKILCINSIALLIFLTSCGKDDFERVREESQIEEDANITKRVDMEPISGVMLDIKANLTVSKSDRQFIKIVSQQDVVNKIQTDVKDGVWEVKFIEEDFSTNKDIKIEIGVETLESLALSGSGSIKYLDAFTTSSLDITVSGSGSVEPIGSSEKLSVTIDGSGSVNALELASDECTVSLSGSGGCTVNVSKTLNATIDGSGSVSYKGDAEVTKAVNGSGTVTKLE